jgi:hypothetical protein
VLAGEGLVAGIAGVALLARTWGTSRGGVWAVALIVRGGAQVGSKNVPQPKVESPAVTIAE